MRMSISRSSAAWIVSFTMALAAILVSGWILLNHRNEALSANNNLRACQEIAKELQRLRGAPSRAGLEAQSATELSRRIEQAAQSGQIAREKLLRIDPQSAKRVGDSSYKEQSTFIELEAVPLPKLIAFLDAITRDEAGLEVRSLRLSAPQRTEEMPTGEEEPWVAEVTLTHLIYAPKNAPPR